MMTPDKDFCPNCGSLQLGREFIECDEPTEIDDTFCGGYTGWFICNDCRLRFKVDTNN